MKFLIMIMHRSILSLFLFRHGLKSELEEISQIINFLSVENWDHLGMLRGRLNFELEDISEKFHFLLKGTVSGKFLNVFWTLNKRPDGNGIKIWKIPDFKSAVFLLEDRPYAVKYENLIFQRTITELLLLLSECQWLSRIFP